MFSAFCALFRSKLVRPAIDLTTDLHEVGPQIAQKMIEKADRINKVLFFLVGTASVAVIFTGLAGIVVATGGSSKDEEKLLLGIFFIALGGFIFAINYHNHCYFKAVQLPKLRAIANRGQS